MNKESLLRQYKTKRNPELFVRYSIECCQEGCNIDEILEGLHDSKKEELINGFEWVRDTLKYLTIKPEPARADNISALDFFLSGSHYTLSLDCDRNSFLDLFSEKMEKKEPFPWKEIKTKVKSDIDRKIIRDAFYWASLCYKQYEELKGDKDANT